MGCRPAARRRSRCHWGGQVGGNWGIFVAFLLGAVLVYAGWQMRAHKRPEPLLDGDDPHSPTLEGDPNSVVSTVPLAKPATAPKPPLEGQLSFEDADDQKRNG